MKKDIVRKKIWVKPHIFSLSSKKTEGGTPIDFGEGTYASIDPS